MVFLLLRATAGCSCCLWTTREREYKNNYAVPVFVYYESTNYSAHLAAASVSAAPSTAATVAAAARALPGPRLRRSSPVPRAQRHSPWGCLDPCQPHLRRPLPTSMKSILTGASFRHHASWSWFFAGLLHLRVRQYIPVLRVTAGSISWRATDGVVSE